MHRSYEFVKGRMYKMKNKRGKTLRLLMRQWQGGNNPPYVLGAHLFNWLAPKTNDPFEEMPGCSQSL
ncbi:hypothetical protein DX926_01305 [Bacillus atrophaeus]|nr:hypothetical protein DX926_01305 [Bacillus atrophaeus]